MNAYDKAQIVKTEMLKLAEKDAQKIQEACVNGAVDYDAIFDEVTQGTSNEYISMVIDALQAI